MIRESMIKEERKRYAMLVDNDKLSRGPRSDLEDLVDMLNTDKFIFGKGSTPVGKKWMAAVEGSDVFTHFWDSDDGWQSLPEKFYVKQ